MKRLFAATAIAALPVVAQAQEVIGTATGTIDGEEHTWFLTAQDGQSQSDFSEMGSIVDVSILAHASPDTIMSTKDGLMLSWSVFDMANPAPQGVELRYMAGDSFMQAYTAPEDAPVTLDLSTFTKVEDGLHVAGMVTGSLGWSEGIGSSPDMADSHEVAISFDAVVPALD
ncbi:hypothetical protein [Salibaculum griseiflavum]|uniref:Uncharacterized protein n=1 Tax=Salibaculum griseiflavum TaxID=1914409 RepID=A0A2V1P9Q0_9RHOB|nr:hypothetical protein [Salibaculum griseiflavum]PWG18057.1 hypothetical protein DFK10_01955 [Salibaculum griseiflavum]